MLWPYFGGAQRFSSSLGDTQGSRCLKTRNLRGSTEGKEIRSISVKSEKKKRLSVLENSEVIKVSLVTIVYILSSVFPAERRVLVIVICDD